MTLLFRIQLGKKLPLFCLSARTTTPKKFLLLFFQPFHAQGAVLLLLKRWVLREIGRVDLQKL